MISYADVIVDLQAGDTGKGKVAHALAKEYDLILRYNGGANAGHTVYHDGKKVVTHLVPIGVLFGIPSIIGLGCVVNIPKLMEEIRDLQAQGIKTDGLIFVDKRAQIDGRRNLIRRHTIRLPHIDRARRTCRRQRTQSRTMVHTDPLRMSCSQRSKHPRNSCILRSPRKSLPNYNLEQHCTAPGSPRLRSPARRCHTPAPPSPRSRCILLARYTLRGHPSSL